MAHINAIILAVVCVLVAVAAVAGVIVLLWPRPDRHLAEAQPADKENHGVRNPL